jgi:hypothetical protein
MKIFSSVFVFISQPTFSFSVFVYTLYIHIYYFRKETFLKKSILRVIPHFWMYSKRYEKLKKFFILLL